MEKIRDLASGLRKEELTKNNEDLQKQDFVPEDVAGYEDKGLVFGAIWVTGNPTVVRRRLSLGIPESEHQKEFDSMVKEGFLPVTVQRLLLDKQTLFTQVFEKGRSEGWEQQAGVNQATFAAKVNLGLCVDASIAESEPNVTWYSYLRYPSATKVSNELSGPLDEQHSAKCQSLAAKGYRPAAVSVHSTDSPSGKMVTTVWHLLKVSDDDREKLARRQANAAVGLLRMNQMGKAWQVLKHSRDPRARSYLIHRLSPLGVAAGAIVKQLDREADVTIRRALVLSLGEYGEKNFTPPTARRCCRSCVRCTRRTAILAFMGRRNGCYGPGRTRNG